LNFDFDMKPLKALLNVDMLEDLATRSNFRYGKQMAEDGDVEVLESNAFNLKAKVQHGEKQGRTVELMSTSRGFRHHCTCSARKDLFCQHRVAVGLAAIER